MQGPLIAPRCIGDDRDGRRWRLPGGDELVAQLVDALHAHVHDQREAR